VESIVSAHLKAMGLAQMKGITTIRMEGKILTNGTTGRFMQWIQRPDKIRIDVTIGEKPMIQAVDGETGWMVTPMARVDGPIPMPLSQVESLRRQISLEGLLYDYKARGFQVTLLGTEIVNGTEAYKLKVVHHRNQVTELLIGKATSLLLLQRDYREMGGEKVVTETRLSDFRRHGGAMFPYKVAQVMNGKVAAEISLEKVVLNEAIPGQKFSQP